MIVINRLIQLLAGCDLCDVTALRKLYHNNDGNEYEYNGIKILCRETHKSTPETIRFLLRFPLLMLGMEDQGARFPIPVADYCLRDFAGHIEHIRLETFHATGKTKYTGRIEIHQPGPQMLLRNSSFIKDDTLTIALNILFPVHIMEKRNVVAGKLSVQIVRKELARAIRNFIDQFDRELCGQFIRVYRRQQELRQMLKVNGLVGFIANGSILPRESGSETPLANAVPFQSPPEDQIGWQFTDGEIISGMGIKRGVTVVTGGGYSGKSTLLDSIQAAVWNHTPADGREYCVTDPDCFKICAEDGRCVSSLDITPFIRNTACVNTDCFSSAHASGSTSQAANIMESVAFGCKLLLIDEDRTATNFMIRDSRMKQIIQNDPIIPFTDRVRQLYEEAGVSTILIIGGSSEYLDVADHLYIMEQYRIRNYSKEAEQTRQHPRTYYQVTDEGPVRWFQTRKILAGTLSSMSSTAELNRIREFIAVDKFNITVGELEVNVARIESLFSPQQIAAAAFLIRHLALCHGGSTFDLQEGVEKLYQKVEREGLDVLISSYFKVMDDLEMPCRLDLLAAISRIPGIRYTMCLSPALRSFRSAGLSFYVFAQSSERLTALAHPLHNWSAFSG